MAFRLTALLFAGITVTLFASGQENYMDRIIPDKYLTQVAAEAGQMEQKLDRKFQKTLRQWQKVEARLKKKLTSVDSARAAAIFGNADQQYRQLEQKLQQTGKLNQYIPFLDSVHTSLKFLQQNPQFLSQTKEAQEKVKNALGKLNGLENQFQKADEIKKFLWERRQYLKERLAGLGFTKELKQLNKQTFYYRQQVQEYKSLLKDHKKAERKAMELLSRTKLFKDFMRKNSQLASLFRLPGRSTDPSSQVSLAGLQTRAQVNSLIQQQILAGGSNAQAQFRQNLQQAQIRLNELKNKAGSFDLSQSMGHMDVEAPEGFRPNSQKVKGFFKRLEPGINIQSQKANGYWPVTSDIGLSLGYRLNDRSTLGIGASYKLGLGKDIRHINFTHQGLGLRSFLDWKMKGSFWLTAAYETNYHSEFKNIEELKYMHAWQKSGLIGVSRVITMKTKFFRETKVQLLWDMLSYQQIPNTPSVVFRIGYQF